MTKEELHNFIGAKLLENAAGLSYGYSHGELDIEAPDRPITHREFRISFLALQTSIVDALESLGLVDNG